MGAPLWEILYPPLITSLCFFRNKLNVKLISSKPSLKSLVENNGGWTNSLILNYHCNGNWFGWVSDENQRQTHCYLKAAVYSEHKQKEIKIAPWTEYKISMRINSLIKANPGFKLMCDIIKTHNVSGLKMNANWSSIRDCDGHNLFLFTDLTIDLYTLDLCIMNVHWWRISDVFLTIFTFNGICDIFRRIQLSIFLLILVLISFLIFFSLSFPPTLFSH